MLLVVSGTLGDALPAARLAEHLTPSIDVSVLTNARYFPLFPTVRRRFELPYDPAELLASKAGQRLIEGGLVGTRRILGLYQTVKPHIRTSVAASAELLQQHSAVIAAGIPFGIGPLAEAFGIPVVRILYQPHWPNDEIKSLFINSSVTLPRRLNRPSHRLADLVARCLFGHEVREVLSDVIGDDVVYPSRRLLDESYWYGHRTVFSMSPPFAHRVAQASDNAVVAGFIRPRQIKKSAVYSEFLRTLDSRPGGRPLIYVGFGSMKSRRTARIISAIAEARSAYDLDLIVQGGGSIEDYPGVIHAPFGDHHELFARCTGLIHHGGAGTVLASLQSGRPFSIVPQWADQFYWGERTAALNLAVPHCGHEYSVAAWRKTLASLLDQEMSSPERCMRRIEHAGSDGLSVALDQVFAATDESRVGRFSSVGTLG